MVLKEFFARRKFPKILSDEWFAYNAIPHKHRAKNEYHNLIPYWDKDRQYISYGYGDIVPMKRIGVYVGFYKIIKIKKPYGDYASWDDGRKYDLVFVYCKLHPNKIGDELLREKPQEPQ